MTNNIPCGNCFQTQWDFNHSREVIHYDWMNRVKEAERFNELDKVQYLRQAFDQIMRDSHKAGYDGHAFNPMSNLDYLEMLYDQRLSGR